MSRRDFLNSDVVGDLRLSRKIVGELLPVIVDQHGRVINGRHRLAAGWKSRIVKKVKDDEEFAILRLHFLSVQRMATEKERAQAIEFLANVYEKKDMHDSDVVKSVLEKSPLNRTYTYGYIPDRFKRSGGYAPRRPQIRNSDFVDSTRRVGDDILTPTPLPSERKSLEWPCPHCGCPADWRDATWLKPAP